MLGQLSLHRLRGNPVSEIHDRQHSEIERKQQNLRASIIKGSGMEQIIASAQELISATLEHFQSEEQAMAAATFSNFSAHRRWHRDIIESLKDISSDLEQRRIRGALELIKFFDSRLTYHLDVEDAALERELKKAQ